MRRLTFNIAFFIALAFLFPSTVLAQDAIGGGLFQQSTRTIRFFSASPSTCATSRDNIGLNSTTGLLGWCSSTNVWSYVMSSSGGAFTGQVNFSNGTAAEPSWGWTSDDDTSGTGMFRGCANCLSFATNGVERWLINASGSLEPLTAATYDIGGVNTIRDIGVGRDATVAGQVRVASGTASEPGVVFTSEDDGTGTGLYLSAAGVPALSINGVGKVFVTDTGIGFNAAPASNLEGYITTSTQSSTAWRFECTLAGCSSVIQFFNDAAAGQWQIGVDTDESFKIQDIAGSVIPFRISPASGVARLPLLNPTAGTMTDNTTGIAGSLRDVTTCRDWTNAMVVALGAGTSGNVAWGTLPAKTKVLDASIVITGAAVGPATVTVSFGRTAATYIDYIVASNAKAAANTFYGDASGERGTNLTGYDLPSYTGTTVLNAQFVSTGANLDTVTGSTGTICVTTRSLP